MNLRRRCQSTALLSTRSPASPKKVASRPEMSNYCLLYSSKLAHVDADVHYTMPHKRPLVPTLTNWLFLRHEDQRCFVLGIVFAVDGGWGMQRSFWIPVCLYAKKLHNANFSSSDNIDAPVAIMYRLGIFFRVSCKLTFWTFKKMPSSSIILLGCVYIGGHAILCTFLEGTRIVLDHTDVFLRSRLHQRELYETAVYYSHINRIV